MAEKNLKSNKMEDNIANPGEDVLEIKRSSNNINENDTNFSSLRNCLKGGLCFGDREGESKPTWKGASKLSRKAESKLTSKGESKLTKKEESKLTREGKSKLARITNCETMKCYKCGLCGEKFNIIDQLHNHFLGNHSSGSYHYDHFTRTAFPKFDTVCVGTQTSNTLQENHRQPRKRKLKKKLSPENSINEHFSYNKKKSITTAGQCNEKENTATEMTVSSSTVTVKPDLDDAIQMDNYQSDGTDDYYDDYEEYNSTAVIDRFLKGSDSHSNTDVIDNGISEDTVDQSDSSKNCSRTEKKKPVRNEKKLSDSKKDQSSDVSPAAKQRSRKQLKPKSVREKFVTSVEPAPISNHRTAAMSDSSESKRVTDAMVDPLPREQCKCSICDAVFSFKRGLLRHEETKHAADMKFECEICHHKFMREYNLQKHIKCVHTVGKRHKNSERNKRKNEEENQSDTAAEIDVKSEMTGETKEMDDDSGLDNMEVKVEKSPKKNNTALSSKMPHTCEICGYTMPISKMDVHRRLHTGERPYVCSLCGKGLISQNKLKRHMLIHSEVKKHTCDTCGAGFQMKYKLRMHQHIHTGKKPYLCSICGVEFNHSANLATHTRCVHRQIKPFVCTKCGGRYAKRSQLDDHVLSHSDEKQFTCRYCGKSFKYYKGMRRHEKTHTEEKAFPCDQCDCSFSQQENLDHHKQTHDTQKLPCQKCGKEFSDRKSLTEHESTAHSKVKPFQCSLCKERYQLVHQFHTHMLAAHNVGKDEAQVMQYEQTVRRSNPSTLLVQNSDVQINTNLPLMYESGSTMPEISVSVSASAKGANKIIPSLSVSQVVSGIMEENRSEINALTRVATENLRLHSEDIRDDEKLNAILSGVHPMDERRQDISLPSASSQNVAMETNNAINALGFHPDGPMRALAHLSHVSHVLHGDGHQGQQQDGGSSVTMGQLHLGEGLRLSHDAQSINPSLLLLNDNLRMQQGLAVSRATPVAVDVRFKDLCREPGGGGTPGQAAGDFVCVRDGWWGRRDERGHTEGPGGGGLSSWEHADGHC